MIVGLLSGKPREESKVECSEATVCRPDRLSLLMTR